MSVGNFHNNVRRAHRGSVIPIAFLAIPKCEFSLFWLSCYIYVLSADHEDDNDLEFRHFRRQLFHASLSYILQPLKPGMTHPIILRFPDGHFRRAIFDIGPYIADYPEQALLACIVNGWCPR